jgi:hypothetical protein
MGVVVMMMVMVVNNHHNLRLRRIRNRETEDESHSEQIFFHAFRMTQCATIRSAILTDRCECKILRSSAHGSLLQNSR